MDRYQCCLRAKAGFATAGRFAGILFLIKLRCIGIGRFYKKEQNIQRPNNCIAKQSENSDVTIVYTAEL